MAGTRKTHLHRQKFRKSSEELNAHLAHIAHKHDCAEFSEEEGLTLHLGMYVSGTKEAPEKHSYMRQNGRYITKEDGAHHTREVLHAARAVHDDLNHRYFENVNIEYLGQRYPFKEVFFDHDHGTEFLKEILDLDKNYRQRPFLLFLKPQKEGQGPIRGYKTVNGDDKAVKIPTQNIRADLDGIEVDLVTSLYVWHDPDIVKQLAKGQPVGYIGAMFSEPGKLRVKAERIQSEFSQDRKLYLNFTVLHLSDLAAVSEREWSPESLMRQEQRASQEREQRLLDL